MDSKTVDALKQHPIVERVQEYHAGVTNGASGGFAEWHSFRGFYQSWMSNVESRSRYPDDYANLRLAVYLAAFGMYRGSAFLWRATHSIHDGAWAVLDQEDWSDLQDCDFRTAFDKAEQISGLIVQLTNAYEPLRSGAVDVPDSKPEAESAQKTNEGKQADGNAFKTLATKVVLGTLVCLPAYDAYACSAGHPQELVAFAPQVIIGPWTAA